MKTIKILTILILLMGFGTVYSQQTSTELQKVVQKDITGQQDRTTFSPNPAPGDVAKIVLPAQPDGTEQTAPEEMTHADAISSPNKPSDPASSPMTAFSNQAQKNVKNVEPSPNGPNGVRPETK